VRAHDLTQPRTFGPPAPQELQNVLTTSFDAIGAYSQNNPEWAAVSKKQGVVARADPEWLRGK
jgi:hypothetical protein